MKSQGFYKRYKKCCIVIMVFLISLCLLSEGLINVHGAKYSENNYTEETRNILILNSYEDGYSWTSEQSDAISERLLATLEDALVFVEYMDWKYHPEERNLQQLYELYKYKYSNVKLDLIFATDNVALEFALKHRKEFLSDAPIVFSGITKGAADTMLKDEKNVVGVFEIHDPVGTMKAAAAINPNIKNVYLIYDNTESGTDLINVVLESGIRDSYNLLSLNTLNIDQIQDKVSRLDNDSIVLMGAYTVDAQGLKLPAEKFSQIISKASTVPIYDMWNIRMGDGVLGGRLLRGMTMGNNAAELGIRILKGEAVDTIDSIDDSIVEYVFDYEQMERFNIPLKELPKGSVIINKPFSFFETYKNLVIGTIVIFVLMSSFIILLMNNIRKRKKAEEEVLEANQELTALYEEVSASDEQLKFQLEELVSAHDKLQVSEEKYRLVAEAANDIIWEWEMGSNKLKFSSRLKSLLGYCDEEIRTMQDWQAIVSAEDSDYVKNMMESFMKEEKKNCTCEYRIRNKNNRNLWIITKAKVLFDQFGYPYKIVGSHTDITQLKEHQNKIMHMAYHDTLTELPNRSYLKEYVENQIVEDPDSIFAMLYIDIDNFKSINDSFGHGEGDKLLVEIGKKFSSISKGGSAVFRLGGDEYVIVLKAVMEKEEISHYLRSMFKLFVKPVKLGNRNLHITISAGAVIYPMDGTNFNELLKNADIAMYHVKNSGKNNFVFFDKSMKEGIKEKMFLENSMREAVKNMNFTLNYQPMLDIKTGRIYGLEALIRWNCPELGPVSPVVFIKLAEENGLIIPIGNWVLRTGCSYAAKLATQGYPDVSISINISPLQLTRADFVDNVKAIISSSGIEPERINLEITESILIDSFDSSLKKLHELREFGVHISLDDFGQGFSSLTYLRRLPINTLKIDKSFIDDISYTESSNQIVYSIIELAHIMKLMVIAEGVETEEQLQYLEGFGCDAVQGFLISRPVPEAEVLDLLRRVASNNKQIK
jgi:diguanylate cyclase (GGDEF)-like protein/PAS domain S-box-containing protein